jgi:dipeptidyl aminopeptidase/acylaminoacyl peptidase
MEKLKIISSNARKYFLVKFKFVIARIILIGVFILSIIFNGIILIYSFITLVVLFIIKVLTSRLPLQTDEYDGPYTYVYKQEKKDKLKLDIWYPLETRKKYPVVFFAHGGGWIAGFRNQPNNVSWCRYLASRGFAAVSIDYRYGFKSTMFDILSDYDDGLKYIREHSQRLGFDDENIFLMGLSAGGHMSLLYAAYNTFVRDFNAMKGVRAIVAYYAPSDLQEVFSVTDSVFAKIATRTTLKGSPKKLPNEYAMYSPIKWISERMVPVLLVHGKEDKTVPVKSSYDMYESLLNYKVDSELIIHRHGGHTFEFELKDIDTLKIIRDTVNFMKEHIKNED